MAGIKTDIWAMEIAENIFPNNTFAAQSMNDSSYVNNDEVYLPQSGAVPSVVQNRATFPSPIAARVDSYTKYQMQEFSTDTTVIRNMETVALSYNKRADVLRDHVEQLKKFINEFFLYNWLANTSGGIIYTSGGLRPASATGANGQRKAFRKDDIMAAMLKLDTMDIPRQGRVILMNPQFHTDLLADTQLTSRDWTNNSLENGAIGRLFGFDTFIRSNVGAYANGSVLPKAPSSVTAGSDNAAALVWHPDFVRRAEGQILVNLSSGVVPEQYGHTMSAEVRAGASPRYTDRRGVVSIVEQA
jgi:Phage capsid protein